MLVKICGLTRAVDVPPAVEAGATHLGMIFAAASPRCVSVDEARLVREAIPPHVTAVGVFRGQTVDEVLAIAAELSLPCVQLHGGYEESAITRLRDAGLQVIWAIPVDERGRWSGTVIVPDIYLLDTQKAGVFGGTGAAFSWSSARRPTTPFLVAGGIGPHNLHIAIGALHPDGIDIGSAVEAAPGIKSHERLRALGTALQTLNHEAA